MREEFIKDLLKLQEYISKLDNTISEKYNKWNTKADKYYEGYVDGTNNACINISTYVNILINRYRRGLNE